MRNEDHRIAALAPTPHDCEDLIGQVRRERRCDFVKHEHDRIGRQRAGQVDKAQNRIRNVPRQLAKVDIPYSQVVEMVSNVCEWDIGQSHVLADRQIGNERRVLVDRDDAGATRFGG